MIYLHLQNQLISNSHFSTYYNKLLYVCGGEGYCELLVNFAGTSIAGMRERERRPDSVKHLSLNHDQAHKLVV